MIKWLTCLLSLALLPAPATLADFTPPPRPAIESSQEYGPYTIHYSLFPSTFLSARRGRLRHRAGQQPYRTQHLRTAPHR